MLDAAATTVDGAPLMDTTRSETGRPPKAGRREWCGLAVIALPCVLYSMDLTVLNLAVPHLTRDLKPSAAEMLWIVDIYGFLVAGSLVTMGTLGDRIGRRKLLLIGAAAFGAASLLAAFATSAAMLILARALLGIAGATLAPSTLSLIRNMFHDSHQRTVAISVWIASYSAGGAIGPLVGGVLLEYFWWGSVFLIAVPIMVLLLAVGPLLLPEYKDPNAGRLDIASAALSLATVLPIIYGLKRIAEHGLEWAPFAWIAAGLIVGVLFARRQLSLADPMIDLSLFRIRAFSAALVPYLMGGLAMFGIFLFIAQYLQLVLGMGPFEAGVWTAPGGVAFVIGSFAAPAIVRRFSPAEIMTAGLLVGAAGFALLALVDGSNGLVLLIGGYVLFSLGLTPVFTLATEMIVSSAPPERAGAAAAVSETAVEFGGATGIAVFGSIVTALYTAAMAAAIPPELAPQAAEAARATLGGALDVAASLPEPATLVHAAREAFSSAFRVIALLGALILLAASAMSAVMLRGSKAPAGGSH